MDTREGKHLHDAMDFVGLRAQATAVGLLQLTVELVNAGVSNQAAVDRIKQKIAQDLALKRPPHFTKRPLKRKYNRWNGWSGRGICHSVCPNHPYPVKRSDFGLPTVYDNKMGILKAGRRCIPW